MSAPFPGRTAPRLNIGDALHDGWQAFCRNPRAFVLYALLLWGLQVFFQLLQTRIGHGGELSSRASDWVLALVGLVGACASFLWGRISLVRGALRSLEGHRPSFAELCRWEDGPILRLFWASLLLGTLLVGSALIITVGVGGPLYFLASLAQARGGTLAPIPDQVLLLLLVLLVALVGLWLVAAIYLKVNQQFQAQICLNEQLGPWATLRRGRDLADPHWPLLLLLLTIEVLLCLLGFLACLVGFFVAWPVVLCVTTAAYRQLLALEGTNRPWPQAEPAP
ncbi:MAG: hypothetical protein WCI65_07795 [Synechococcaceae cyanobacterium ELA263]